MVGVNLYDPGTFWPVFQTVLGEGAERPKAAAER